MRTDNLQVKDVTTGEDAGVRGRKDEDGAFPVIVKKSDGAGGYEIWDGTVTVDSIAVDGDLFVELDDVEEYILNQRLHYLFVDSLEDSGYTYLGFEDKDGNYYLQRINDTTQESRFYAGTGGIPDPSVANWVTGKSYGKPASTF